MIYKALIKKTAPVGRPGRTNRIIMIGRVSGLSGRSRLAMKGRQGMIRRTGRSYMYNRFVTM